MKFDMGQATLTTLTKKTGQSNEDLGSVVKQLAEAALPVENVFHGNARAVFDAFQTNVDDIAAGLNRALASVLTGIGGMDLAFTEGEQQMVDETQSIMGSTNFDSARFAGRA